MEDVERASMEAGRWKSGWELLVLRTRVMVGDLGEIDSMPWGRTRCAERSDCVEEGKEEDVSWVGSQPEISPCSHLFCSTFWSMESFDRQSHSAAAVRVCIVLAVKFIVQVGTWEANRGQVLCLKGLM